MIIRRWIKIKIIDYYILKEVFRSFVFTFALFVSLCFVIILFEELEAIMSSQASFVVNILYVLLRVPHLVIKASPIIVVISIVVTLGNMLRHNEILMLYIAGYSPLRMARPLSGALAMLIVVIFILNETVSGPFSSQAQVIFATQIRGTQEGLVDAGGIWMHGMHDQIYRAGNYIPQANTIEDLNIFEFSGENRTLSRRLHAERSTYDSKAGIWTLYNVTDHHILPNGSIKRDILDQHTYYMDTTPEDFKTITQDPEEMPYSKLRKIVNDFRNAGESPGEFLAYMRINEAFPFAVFFLGLLAFGMILRYGMSGSASGIGIGLVATVCYFLILSLGKSFAESGLFSAWFGAWAPNIICFFFMIYIFYRLKDEV